MQQVAAGVIRDGSGRILLAERFSPCPHGGSWEFPGGTREAGESIEACLHRELAEELGIRVRIDEAFLVLERPYRDRELDLHVFLCTHVDGDPQCLEVKDWRWVEPEDIGRWNLTGADRRIFEALKARWDGASGGPP